MTDHYDVFLSFKNLDISGRPTRDSELADLVYQHLSSRGLSVFFSSVSLEEKGEAEFKKAIDTALDVSQTLVAIGNSAANLESKWVRYEWDSFFTDILSGVVPEGRLFTYVENVSVNSLPRTLRHSQTIIHEQGSLERLHRFIVNGLHDPSTKTTFEIRSKSRFSRKPSVSLLPNTQKSPKYAVPDIPTDPIERDPNIENDPQMSREDKDVTMQIWKSIDLDKQQEKLVEQLRALDQEPDCVRKHERKEALLQQIKSLTRERAASLEKAREMIIRK